MTGRFHLRCRLPGRKSSMSGQTGTSLAAAPPISARACLGGGGAGASERASNVREPPMHSCRLDGGTCLDRLQGMLPGPNHQARRAAGSRWSGTVCRSPSHLPHQRPPRWQRLLASARCPSCPAWKPSWRCCLQELVWQRWCGAWHQPLHNWEARPLHICTGTVPASRSPPADQQGNCVLVLQTHWPALLTSVSFISFSVNQTSPCKLQAGAGGNYGEVCPARRV